MVIGVDIVNCVGATVSGSFNGLDVGVSLSNSDLTLKDAVFNDTTTAVKGIGHTPINAENVSHTEQYRGADASSDTENLTRNESHCGADATPLDIVRKLANANV